MVYKGFDAFKHVGSFGIISEKKGEDAKISSSQDCRGERS